MDEYDETNDRRHKSRRDEDLCPVTVAQMRRMEERIQILCESVQHIKRIQDIDHDRILINRSMWMVVVGLSGFVGAIVSVMLGAFN